MLRRLSALLLVAGAAACAPIAAPGDIDAYRRSVASSDFVRSAAVATALSRPDSEGRASDLQWALNAGSALFHAGEYDRAIAMFDVAENLMSTRDTQATNLQRVYRYGAYDAVMVNTYKALAMLANGNHDGARVEFNRLDERQERTAQQFRDEITAAQTAAEGQITQDGSRRDAIDAALKSPEAQAQAEALQQWAAYAPFQNPAATYLHGLYRLTSGVPSDHEQARTYLQRTAVMVGANPAVNGDLQIAEGAVRGRPVPNAVWVIFENGQSPVLEQLNLTFPAPVIGSNRQLTVRPITVSVPRLVAQPPAYSLLDVQAGGVRGSTRLVASIEGVVASEFRQRWPGHVRDAVIEGVVKAAGMSAVNYGAGTAARQMGGTAGLAVMLLSEVATMAAANTTQSDTRSWYGLPREFQVFRVPLPANRTISLAAQNGPAQTVDVPAGRSSIVLVKAQAPGSPLRVQVIPMSGGR